MKRRHHSRPSFLPLLASILLPASFSPAVAQSSDDLEKELLALLNTKITVASKSAESVNEAPASIVVIPRMEIEGFAAQNLGQVLNRVVGMTFMTADFHTDQSVVVRGEETTPYNNHVLILLNGRPVRDPATGGNNNAIWGAFPLSSIERLEIIRGPGSVLYGSCAYAGVINIVTRTSAADGAKGMASLNRGSHGGFGQEGMVTLAKGELKSMVAFSNFGDKGPEYTFHDYAGNLGTGRFDRHALSAVANLQYKGLSVNAQSGTFDSYSLNGATKTWDPSFKNNMNLTTIDLGYATPLSRIMDFEVNLTWNHSEWVTQNRSNPDNEKTSSMQIEGMLKIRPLHGMNVLIGGGREFLDWNEVPNIARGGQGTTFIYTQLDYRIDKVKLIGGVQFNKIENLESHLSPRFGAILDMPFNSGFKLLYSEAFRKGYPFETAFRNPIIHGNPNLKPELIATTELQYFIQGEKFKGSLTYFQSHLSDVIIRNQYSLDPRPPLPPYYLQYVNGGAFDYKGLEAEGNLCLTTRLLAIGSASYQTNKNQDGVTDAALHPNLLLKLGALYRAANWSLSVFDAYWSKPKSVSVVNPNVKALNREPEATHLVSAKASWTAWRLGTAAFSLSAEAENLLNKDVRYPDFGSRSLNSLQPLSGGATYTSRATLIF